MKKKRPLILFTSGDGIISDNICVVQEVQSQVSSLVTTRGTIAFVRWQKGAFYVSEG